MAVAFRTEWSTPGTIQMPRIGYEQEQLVSASLGASALPIGQTNNSFTRNLLPIVSKTCHLLPKVRGERILCTEQICCRRSRMELTDVILLVV